MSDIKQIIDDIKAIYQQNAKYPMRQETLDRLLNYVQRINPQYQYVEQVLQDSYVDSQWKQIHELWLEKNPQKQKQQQQQQQKQQNKKQKQPEMSLARLGQINAPSNSKMNEETDNPDNQAAYLQNIISQQQQQQQQQQQYPPVSAVRSQPALNTNLGEGQRTTQRVINKKVKKAPPSFDVKKAVFKYARPVIPQQAAEKIARNLARQRTTPTYTKYQGGYIKLVQDKYIQNTSIIDALNKIDEKGPGVISGILDSLAVQYTRNNGQTSGKFLSFKNVDRTQYTETAIKKAKYILKLILSYKRLNSLQSYKYTDAYIGKKISYNAAASVGSPTILLNRLYNRYNTYNSVDSAQVYAAARAKIEDAQKASLANIMDKVQNSSDKIKAFDATTYDNYIKVKNPDGGNITYNETVYNDLMTGK